MGMNEQVLPWFLLLILLPLIGAFICIGTKNRTTDYVASLFTGLTALVGLWMVGRWGFTGVRIHLGGLPQFGRFVGKEVSMFGFLLDPLSAIMLMIVVGLGFLVTVYSVAYISAGNKEHPVTDGRERYFFWMLLFIASMAGLVTSSNFLQLFIFWELTTICSWALIGFYETDRALWGGYKALLMTHGGGLALMVAIVALYLNAGSFDFEALKAISPEVRGALFALIFVFIMVGSWAKAAQFPFHTWLPEAMEAPTPVSAYLHAAAMVKAGVYLAARLILEGGALPYWVGLLTTVMALLTMFFAVSAFFFQDDLKRLLALSTIAHLIYILLGCGVYIMFKAPEAYQGALLHIAAHAAGKGLLFLTVGALTYFAGTRRISELSGVASEQPLIALSFFVGVFTVTGVPPLAAFWSKLFLIIGALQNGAFGYFLAFAMLLESLIAFGWFLHVGQRVFFGTPSPHVEAIEGSRRSIDISLSVLIAACILMPLIALPLASAALGK
jgi:hydrogenase-4 component D